MDPGPSLEFYRFLWPSFLDGYRLKTLPGSNPRGSFPRPRASVYEARLWSDGFDPFRRDVSSKMHVFAARQGFPLGDIW